MDRLEGNQTWRPAREERKTGFVLSLSLFADFPIISPLASVPDIFEFKLRSDSDHQENLSFLSSREGEEDRREARSAVGTKV